MSKLMRALQVRGEDVVVIGGAVRDLLLGRPPEDLDLATSATPDRVLEVAAEEGWLPIPVGKAFGVVRVHLYGVEFEVATYRSEETYSDGRRPDLEGIAFRGSLEEDVRRRDFTMNGLALRLSDDLPVIIDLVDGERDIRARLIRTIGDPRERFDEDALRPLRALRFAAVLGFDIEAATERAIHEGAANLRRVSGERIQQELSKAFGKGDAMVAVSGLLETGLLPHLFPTPTPAMPLGDLLMALMERLDRCPGLPMFLAVLAVACEEGSGEDAAIRCEAMAEHLRLSRADAVAATESVNLAAALSDIGDRTLPRRADLYRAPHYQSAMALARAFAIATGGSHEALDALARERASLPQQRLSPPALVTGSDLKRLGVGQGPRIGALLLAVRDKQVLGEVETREEALAWLREELSEG